MYSRPILNLIIAFCCFVSFLSPAFADSEPNLAYADIAIKLDLPNLGESMKGPKRTFIGGTFLVERVAYLKGDYALGGALEGISRWGPEDTAFKYGRYHLVVHEGDNFVIVVMCKAEFREEIPETPEGFHPRDEIYITDSNGKHIMGVKHTDTRGKTRHFVQGSTSNREWQGPINIYFFSPKRLKW